MKKTKVFAAMSCILFAGCVPDPKSYETPPISVQTPQGVVVCQLYRIDIHAWDRAISYPKGLNSVQADRICVEEGKRLDGK